MNQQMYRAPATQHNLQTLASRGLLLWGPTAAARPAATSARAMLDPLTIVDMAASIFPCQRFATSQHHDYRGPDA
jgi:phosphopantothenoylcysteine decarboxylase/phosphopantothenate--cysteine ligase